MYLVSIVCISFFITNVFSDSFNTSHTALVNEKLFHYSSSRVPNEYIFVYNEFYYELNRHETITAILFSANVTDFEILQKNEIVKKYPSDFDTIRIYNEKNQETNSYLMEHPFVKCITAHQKISRKLKSIDLTKETSTVIIQNKNRKILRAIPKPIIDQINVKFLWNKGFTGQNVKVAIFDTGLEKNHPHFKNVIERIDWTEEKNPDDKIGHGTFVCGLIASNKECLGIAPDADLFIFKVFTNNQISYTSWFLDAFNYAILKNIDVLNLSIGGPDFMDFPFINKVWEITSKNIILVSGIGNDGPLYGTINNPADMNDVIGVGGINSEDQIARFSSRGMTTWELPEGYGRVKPDIVTYCTNVRGSKKSGGCRTLSGTSVASPIVSGAIALLVSVFKKKSMSYNFNPANIKQIIMASSKRVSNANMYEQGNGKLNLVEAYRLMKIYTPQASLIPSYLDLTECPYFWPFCSQPLYFSGMPIIVNITVLNGMDVTSRFKKRPEWHPSKLTHGEYLKMSFDYSQKLWPWSGYFSVMISVSSNSSDFDGVVDGYIKILIESSKYKESEISLYVKARIIPTPMRKHRLLWDQFHNLRYPPGYFPRDNLRMKNDPLDWNGDHLHTNFKEMYQYLRNADYYIEVLGKNFNCFDAENYGALLIVDSEEEFHNDEIEKLYSDITKKGLSLIIFADWYNTSVIKAAKFFDENTKKLWTPVTGGSNIPAINDLLSPFGIAFGDRVFEGDFKIGDHSTNYASGSSIIRFPNSPNGYLIYRDLVDQGEEFLKDSFNATKQKKRSINQNVAILGLYQSENNENTHSKPGRVVAYGDSNCLDSSHMKADCYWLLSAVIEYAIHNNIYRFFKESPAENFESVKELPKRLIDLGFEMHSKFAKITESELTCKSIVYEPNFPINKVTIQYLPTKKNYYNFLKLKLKISSEDIDVDLDGPNEYEKKDYAGELIKSNKSLEENIIKETEFPFFISLVLVFALACIFFKIKKRIRFKSLKFLKKFYKC